jgi:hypothetical protein
MARSSTGMICAAAAWKSVEPESVTAGFIRLVGAGRELVVARHDEERDRALVERAFEHVLDRVAGPRTGLVGDDVVPMTVLELVLDDAPLRATAVAEEDTNNGPGLGANDRVGRVSERIPERLHEPFGVCG